MRWYGFMFTSVSIFPALDEEEEEKNERGMETGFPVSSCEMMSSLVDYCQMPMSMYSSVENMYNNAQLVVLLMRFWLKLLVQVMAFAPVCCLVALLVLFPLPSMGQELDSSSAVVQESKQQRKDAEDENTLEDSEQQEEEEVRCICETPRKGTAERNRIVCSDGIHSWCSSHEECYAFESWVLGKTDQSEYCRRSDEPNSECLTEYWAGAGWACADCRALVAPESRADMATCDRFCALQEFGLSCIAAWTGYPVEEEKLAAEDYTGPVCQMLSQQPCWRNFSQLLVEDVARPGQQAPEMICECGSFEQEKDECWVRTWQPVSRYDKYCGSCTKLTPFASLFATCRRYCAHQERGLNCVASYISAGKEQPCGVLARHDCDFTYLHLDQDNTTQYMLCECSPQTLQEDERWSIISEGEEEKERQNGQSKHNSNIV
eukprot:g67995.t1